MFFKSERYGIMDAALVFWEIMSVVCKNLPILAYIEKV